MGDLGGGLAIREKAINLVKDAVEKDKAADYPQARRERMRGRGGGGGGGGGGGCGVLFTRQFQPPGGVSSAYCVS